MKHANLEARERNSGEEAGWGSNAGTLTKRTCSSDARRRVPKSSSSVDPSSK